MPERVIKKESFFAYLNQTLYIPRVKEAIVVPGNISKVKMLSNIYTKGFIWSNLLLYIYLRAYQYITMQTIPRRNIAVIIQRRIAIEIRAGHFSVKYFSFGD